MSSTSGRQRAASGQRRSSGGSYGPSGANRRARPSQRASQPARSIASASALSLDRALQAALDVPEPAARTFSELGLPGPLVGELAARGIREPFAIQSRALPDAIAGRDVLGRAQTGSGKTLAFGLPMLARLALSSAALRQKAPHGLVLVPTRELAVQVAEVLVPLGQSLRLSVLTVYGGVALSRQIDRLRRGVDIVVATPGRLIDLLDRGACTLDDVEITVIDEADHMADLGFMPAVTRILDATPAGGQRMLFSATLDRGVDRLVSRYLSEPAMHAVSPVSTASDVEHRVFVLPASDKVAIAAEIGGRDGRTLIFVRTKHGADRLAKQLSRAGVDAAAIHGNLNQNQRQRALAAFAAGQPRVLVATDVAARGIHVDDIGLVMHFDPPNDHKDYLHRSGRTARAGATGTVVALVEPAQVREIGRMHEAAGVISTSHRVEPGHDAVRQIATSGTPIVVTAIQPHPAPGNSGRASGGRAPYSSASSRSGRTSGDRSSRTFAPGSPGRRPAQARPARYQRTRAAS